jgi:hypothetical protein
MRTVPETPRELLEELIAIFPAYRPRASMDDEAPTFHSVLIEFTSYLGADLSSFSAAQLRSFGTLVSAAVEAGGALENAFGTCLLEHLHQIRASKALRPFLSKRAREATHA